MFCLQNTIAIRSCGDKLIELAVQGWLQTGNGQERVVLKRVKSRVEVGLPPASSN